MALREDFDVKRRCGFFRGRAPWRAVRAPLIVLLLAIAGCSGPTTLDLGPYVATGVPLPDGLRAATPDDAVAAPYFQAFNTSQNPARITPREFAFKNVDVEPPRQTLVALVVDDGAETLLLSFAFEFQRVEQVQTLAADEPALCEGGTLAGAQGRVLFFVTPASDSPDAAAMAAAMIDRIIDAHGATPVCARS